MLSLWWILPQLRHYAGGPRTYPGGIKPKKKWPKKKSFNKNPKEPFIHGKTGGGGGGGKFSSRKFSKGETKNSPFKFTRNNDKEFNSNGYKNFAIEKKPFVSFDKKGVKNIFEARKSLSKSNSTSSNSTGYRPRLGRALLNQKGETTNTSTSSSASASYYRREGSKDFKSNFNSKFYHPKEREGSIASSPSTLKDSTGRIGNTKYGNDSFNRRDDDDDDRFKASFKFGKSLSKFSNNRNDGGRETKFQYSKSSSISIIDSNDKSKARAQAPTEYLDSLPARFQLSSSEKLDSMNYEQKGRWSDLGLSESLVKALQSQGLITPNPMQLSTIPILLKGKASLLFAAETGSGKTLAYLIPIIEKLKAEEKLDSTTTTTDTNTDTSATTTTNANAIIRQDSKPRAVILVPSNELVNQVYSVAKNLSHHVKLRVEKISGAQDFNVRKRSSEGPIDLLIATPGQLLSITEDGLLELERVTHLSIDEADTLLSDDFGEEVAKLLKLFNPSPSTIAVSSATIPKSLVKHLDQFFPMIQRLGSPKLHTASERVDVRFVDVRRPGNVKLQTCEELLTRNHQKSTLLFCNTSDFATKVHRLLSENKELMDTLNSVPSLLHGGIPERQRQAIITRFQQGDIKYLVCTDLASRGLDTTQVGHVIMYDFPRNTIDFIHRAGRTGRLVGTRGLVTCLVSSRDEDLAKAIKQAIKSGTCLANPTITK